MRCKHCKVKFDVKWFNQKYCLQNDECIESASIESARKAKLEREKKEKKEWVAKKGNLRNDTKKLSDYENEAKKSFQLWVRLRDNDLPCISCGCTNSNQWAGGHYFDAGKYSGLIFHEDNVHKQCNKYCNQMLAGNKPNYRINLVKRIGIERVEWLEENSNRLRQYKYSKTELIEIKNKYDKLNKLKQ